jgi:hypothetical protein
VLTPAIDGFFTILLQLLIASAGFAQLFSL